MQSQLFSLKVAFQSRLECEHENSQRGELVLPVFMHLLESPKMCVFKLVWGWHFISTVTFLVNFPHHLMDWKDFYFNYEWICLSSLCIKPPCMVCFFWQVLFLWWQKFYRWQWWLLCRASLGAQWALLILFLNYQDNVVNNDEDDDDDEEDYKE